MLFILTNSEKKAVLVKALKYQLNENLLCSCKMDCDNMKCVKVMIQNLQRYMKGNYSTFRDIGREITLSQLNIALIKPQTYK